MSRHTARLVFAIPQEIRSEIIRQAFASAKSATRVTTTSATSLRTYSRSVGTFSSHSRSLRQSYPRRNQSTTSPPSPTLTDDPTPPPSSTTTPPTPPTSRLIRILTFTTLITLTFTLGFSMAAAPATTTVTTILDPPTDEETLSLFQPAPTTSAAAINDHIINHPLAQRLRADPTWRESRPHLKIPPAMRPHNLTAGTLLGDEMISVPPLSFNEKGAELPKMIQISHLGSALCGHPGLVHGGLLATVLDEGLARCCFPALPNKVGVTASLKIDYRTPCPAGSYVVFKAETTKVEGRKAWVKGWIEVLGEEDGTGVKVVEAEALFVEPRQAANLARIYSGS